MNRKANDLQVFHSVYKSAFRAKRRNVANNGLS